MLKFPISKSSPPANSANLNLVDLDVVLDESFEDRSAIRSAAKHEDDVVVLVSNLSGSLEAKLLDSFWRLDLPRWGIKKVKSGVENHIPSGEEVFFAGVVGP